MQLVWPDICCACALDICPPQLKDNPVINASFRRLQNAVDPRARLLTGEKNKFAVSAAVCVCMCVRLFLPRGRAPALQNKQIQLKLPLSIIIRMQLLRLGLSSVPARWAC
jgi:hypothetical protein